MAEDPAERFPSRLTLLFVLGSFFVVFAAPLSAQLPPFCEALKSSPDTYGYQQRGQGERCEGMYVAPVSGAAIELISLHRASRLPTVHNNTVLVVSAPVLAGEYATRKVRVRSVAKSLRTYYQMDGEISLDRPLRWPIADVLGPQRLYPNDFGVFGWIDDTKTGRVFVPVQLAADKTVAATEPITILIRPSVPLEKLTWRVRSRNATSVPSWTALAPGRIYAGKVVSLVWPTLETSRPGETVNLEVAAQSLDGSWVPTFVAAILPH